MSNLLNSPAGVAALREATADVVRMRIRRWFERNTVIGFDNWVLAGKPALTINDALSVLDSLNVAHDKEILDLLDLLYRIEQTASDIDIDFYVNTVTGDDINGDGSSLHPFKSLPYAQRLVPDKINSKINIFVSAPASNPVTVMEDMIHVFGNDGQLTIQGTDLPIVESGPYIVNTFTDIGVAQAFGHSIVPVAPPGWIADEKVGYFIHVLSGIQQGCIYAIMENTPTELIICNTYNPIAPGDSFEIVKPGTTIDLSATNIPLNFNLKYKLNLAQKSRFALSSINFINWSVVNFVLENFSIINSFVYSDYSTFEGNNADINHYGLFAPNEILNQYLRTDDYPYYFIFVIDLYSDRMMFFRISSNTVYVERSLLYLLDSGFRSLTMFYGTFIVLSRIYAGTYIVDSISTFEGNHGIEIDSYGIWVQGCSNFINLSKGEISCALMEGIPANITGYTVMIGGVSNMTFDGTPVSGVTGDVFWQSTGAAAAFPGVAGTSITDGNGSYVVKMT